MFYFICAVSWADSSETIDAELARLVSSVGEVASPGERIVALSSHFIDTPYVANTLIGGPQVPERLVINLTGVDCFTLLDVVEALRRTSVAEDFPEQLRLVRYVNGVVDYSKRRHFFSDWVTGDIDVIVDVTADVSQGTVRKEQKQLNRKSHEAFWLPGIPVTPRVIPFIPTTSVNTAILSGLQPGDYVGVYSDRAGLDVSHTGLIIKKADRVFLRHASSRSGVNRVIDDDLLDYLQGQPGLVVYRVKP